MLFPSGTAVSVPADVAVTGRNTPNGLFGLLRLLQSTVALLGMVNLRYSTIIAEKWLLFYNAMATGN